MGRIAGVVNHEIRRRQSVIARGLGVDPGPRIVIAHASELDEPRHGNIDGAIDHHHPVEAPPRPGRSSGLGQQRDVQNDDVTAGLGFDA